MRSFLSALMMICSISFADSVVTSADDTFTSEWYCQDSLLLENDLLFQNLNQKQGTVYWIHGTDGQELEIGSGRRIYLYSRDKYLRLDRTHNVSWSAWAYLERPKSYQDRRHRNYIVIRSVVIGFGSWMSECGMYLNRLLRRKYIVN